MSRRRFLRPMNHEHVNVTPLIDVVMCLVIFYLVVGQMVRVGREELTLPRAVGAAEMGDQEGRFPINIVFSRSSGATEPGVLADTVPEVWVGGRKREMSELAALLRRERKTLGKVMVRADRGVAYQWISPVLAACAQAEIRDVRFATRPQ